jgi:NAD(P)-dependent dehydrogenase (short-subunit alcohol dehydrogenase family)
MKTNLYGYFYMAKAAVSHMEPGSSIIMTGSVTGLLGNKNLLVGCDSLGLLQLANQWRKNVAAE